MGKEDETGERGTAGTSKEFGARPRCGKCDFLPSSMYIHVHKKVAQVLTNISHKDRKVSSAERKS